MSPLLEAAEAAPAAAPGKPAAARSALAVLREKRGGVPQALLDAVKEQQRIRRLLKAALGEGPRTVPDLSAACALPSHAVLWHLMAMRRYGEVVEAGESERYPLYALTKRPEAKGTCCPPTGGTP
jgi:hypothetical protein